MTGPKASNALIFKNQYLQLIDLFYWNVHAYIQMVQIKIEQV